MHIVVNTRLLLPHGLDGIGWFSHEVLQRLTGELSDWQFTFLFDRPFDKRYIYGENVRGVVLPPPARHPLLYLAYFEWSTARFLEKTRPDLFFSPDGFLSLRASVKQLPVIHDLNFEHRPQDLPWAYRTYYRHLFPRFARKADRILTVSEYSRQDLCQTYGIDAEKISVACNGVHEGYRPLEGEEKKAARQRFAGGNDYWIFIGNFSARKNVHGIVRAYTDYRRSGGTKHLVLVGNPLWQYPEMKEALKASPFEADVHFAGHLQQAVLVHALGGAFGMLFPSFFEGFGIPVVEAFRAGVPVITSNRSALPEVAGEAALLANPDDPSTIAAHMLTLEADQRKREQLVRAGLEQAKKFSWTHTANKVKQAMFLTIA